MFSELNVRVRLVPLKGLVDGKNKVFSYDLPATFMGVFLDGLLLKPGEYLASDGYVRVIPAPQVGSTVVGMLQFESQ